MEHLREGSGPPLLLVHGIGMSRLAWEGVVPLLRDRFECVVVDLPGFGASPPLPGNPTLPALADACRSLMRGDLGFGDHWAVAGNSLGGGIAVHLALLGAVRAACALSPVGFVGTGMERLHLHATITAVGAAAPLLRRTVPPLPGPARRVAQLAFAWHAERRSPAQTAAAFEDLERATALEATRRHAFRWAAPQHASPLPLTIAWGDHDLLLLTGPQSARARERLQGATHVRLPDAGHLPGWDDPALTARTIATAVT